MDAQGLDIEELMLDRCIRGEFHTLDEVREALHLTRIKTVMDQ